MRSKAAVLGLAAVVLLGGCGDDEESSAPTTTVAPATTTTLSQTQLDKQKAGRIILTVADLPGYVVDPPDSSRDSAEFIAAANACANNNPIWSRLGQDNDPRGALSPNFSKGENVTISSSASYGDTEDQARTAIADISTASFPSCFSRAAAAQLKNEPGYTNLTVTTAKLPALTVGDQSVGYRSTIKFRAGGANVTLYVDSTIVRVGRAVASLDYSSRPSPFPEAERARLLNVLSDRMAAL